MTVLPDHERHHPVDLVFEGGGVKAIGLVGAVSVLEERGYRPQNMAGTSAGAIVASLLAAGYTAPELKQIILGMDFNRFKDPTWQSRIPIVGGLASILMTRGLYRGDYVYELMTQYLSERGVHTFRDLRDPDAEGDPRYRYKVQVIASDVTRRQLLVLPKDAAKLGLEPDDLDVALAVRMSISIPIFFEPVRIFDRTQKREHLIVDGGMLSNFPVWLFDSQGVPEWPTFGLKLVEVDPRNPVSDHLSLQGDSTDGLVAYARNLVGTLTEFYDRLYLESDVFVRTITVPTLGVRTTDFDLSRERALALYDAGRGAAERFLETWDFARYVSEFRVRQPRSRRAELQSPLAHARRRAPESNTWHPDYSR